MNEILTCTKYMDILTLNKNVHEGVEISTWDSVYKDLLKKYHTDINKAPEAIEITQKLTGFNRRITNGFKYKDDSGDVTLLPEHILFNGNKDAVNTSFSNLDLLDYKNPMCKLVLPKRDGDMKLKFNQLVISFLELERPVEQKHVNWLINRCYELALSLNQQKYVYLSFIPSSLVIDPIFHGVFPSSFYHLTKKDAKIESISNEYSKWYPHYEIYRGKVATSEIDSKMIRKLALWLLDYKPQIKELFDFYNTNDDFNLFSSYSEHKKIINNLFPNKTFYKF
jgi:hypothetical protein